MRSLVWFRSDLRVDDNPALHAAADAADRGVVAVTTICPEQWNRHDWGAPKADFVRRNLVELRDALEKLRIPLLVRETALFAGVPDVLLDVAREHECTGLFFNREYEVNEADRDDAVREAFDDAGLAVRDHHDQTVIRPGGIETNEGGSYKVFSPFMRKWLARLEEHGRPAALPEPSRQPEMVCPPDDVPATIDGFEPEHDLSERWPAGEAAARKRLERFAEKRLGDYDDERDRPDHEGTSMLSPYLAAGVLSIRRCLDRAWDALPGGFDKETGAGTWISELVWREFYRHVLVGFPRVSRHRPFRLETERIEWTDDEAHEKAWREGRTGVPIVDAGMRQLAATGWMHNRVRMIVAMYFSKDLFLDWRRGERFFMESLVDGDLANNNGGWQWSASTGTDAAPYFRIFNPVRQSERYDPDGTYLRTWVPELRDVEGKAVHDPHARGALDSAGDYPEPIVDRAGVKDRVVSAFKALS